jgi:hypothetical protein
MKVSYEIDGSSSASTGGTSLVAFIMPCQSAKMMHLLYRALAVLATDAHEMSDIVGVQ